MGKGYVKMTTQQLIEYVKKFKWTRQVTQTHFHHTYLPDHSQFNGSNHNELNWGMEDYHVNVAKYATIAQHVTLFPDGSWLLGRDFNMTPASILGWNTGAFCIETLGNFDEGRDTLEGAQADAAYEFCEFMVEVMGTQLRFHRDSPTAYKTCPGSGINRNKFFDNVASFTEKQNLQKQEELRKRMENAKVKYTDMVTQDGKPHWANDFVNYLSEKNIIKGFPNNDGTFRFEPEAPLTRAQAATLIAKALESVEEMLRKK